MTDFTADAAKLLPCPFCGTTDLGSHKFGSRHWMVHCAARGCINPEAIADTRDEATRQWNTRPQPAPSMVAELRTALKNAEDAEARLAECEAELAKANELLNCEDGNVHVEWLREKREWHERHAARQQQKD